MAVFEPVDFAAFVDRARAQSGATGERGKGAGPTGGAPRSDASPSTQAAGDRSRALDAPAYAYAWDHRTRAAFERVKAVELAVSSVVRISKELMHGRLLGHAVKVSERQFPRLDRIASVCAAKLGIAPPTVYIVNSPQVNAATYGTESESFITVHSALVDHYSDEELLAVIGHECGHIHNRHVVYLTTLHYLSHMAGMFVRGIFEPAVLALRAWSRRAEITCDRAAMLCVGDAAIAERAIAKLALGSRKLYEELDIDVFLEQYTEGKASFGRFTELFATHPWLPKRVLAMREFAKSELFLAQAVPSHPGGGRTMTEVDDAVHRLLRGEA